MPTTADNYHHKLPKLGSNNYQEWAVEVQNWLVAKRLWDIVEDPSDRPTEQKAVSDWDVLNAYAKAIILKAVDREQLQHVISLSTAKEQ